MENESLTAENKSTYYYSNNKRIPLARESSVFAVKFVSGRDPRDGSLSRAAFQLLNEQSEDIGVIPNYNFRIFKKQGNELKNGFSTPDAAITREIRDLKAEPSIEYATLAYRRNPDVPVSRLDDLMFSTREFIVQFKPDMDQDEIESLNQRYNVQLQKPVGYVENGFVLIAPEAEGDYGPVVLSNIYFESGSVLFAHPNFVQRKHLRPVLQKSRATKTQVAPGQQIKNALVMRDDYLSRQWHLDMAKVTDAWTYTKGSSSIKVAILDDGVDVTHPEFADKIVSQYDFATGTTDGKPKNTSDNHGTACAGVAVAAGAKAFGAAPGCSLIVGVTPSFLGSVEEGDMFKWVCDQGADVISCSWGPKDGTGAVDPLPDNVRASIHYCVTEGRGGLGSSVFWAAGNGNESVSNDGYAANPDVIAVGASSNKETRSWYSDFGPEVFICAPSSGDRAAGELRIFTVDRMGDDGYNPDKESGTSHPVDDLDYTDSFGGTSSATPLSAGIAALMLSVNSNLMVEDIKQILMDTATKIDTAGGNYDENGHSDFYGYGRIDAAAAVEKAREYTGVDHGGNTSALPAISTSTEINRNDKPPVFEIEKAGRRLFAIEITNEAALFNSAARGDDRNENNFFASWTTGLTESAPYVLPANTWDMLKAANRLYYRIHVADDNNWSNYSISTADDNYTEAPYFDIKTDTSDGDIDDGGSSSALSIFAPSSVSRDSEGPEFEINLGGRQMYAVEISTDANLFDTNANGNMRNSSNFYASWEQGLSTDLPFILPADVWSNLKVADQLYYRLHVADDNSWSNYDVSVGDTEYMNAPFMEVVSGSRFMKDGLIVRNRSGIAPFILAEAKNEDERLWQD
jgi:subtilisin family serine protease